MTDKAIISGVYSNFRAVKTRKCWVIEIEVPEEMAVNVVQSLGLPNQNESQYVAVAAIQVDHEDA